MKRFRITTVAAALLAAALTGLHQQELAGEQQYLIVATDNRLPDNLSAAVANSGGKVTGSIPQIGVAIAVSDQADFQQRAGGIAGVQQFLPDEIIEDAPPRDVDADFEAQAQAAAAELGGLANLQWGLQAVRAPAAWELGVTGKGVRVALIDTGIRTTHPDLAPNLNLELSASFVPGETVEFIPLPGRTFSHATWTAGIIAAADNGFGTIGVAPDAELVPIKVVSDVTGFFFHSWVAQGIVYAADIDADVANLSLGGRLRKRSLDSLFMGTVFIRAVNYARQRGTLVVASAGNLAIDGDHDQDGTTWPRDLPGVLAVAATGPIGWADDPDTNLDLPAWYTNYGQSVIDIAAPGGNPDFTRTAFRTLEGITRRSYVFDMVLSTSSTPAAGTGLYAWNYGTSAAAPHVAGVAALAIEAHGGPMKAERLQAILKESADDLGKPGRDDFYGHGRVNAFNAVLMAAFDEE
jgi:subtilisin family serine protease